MFYQTGGAQVNADHPVVKLRAAYLSAVDIEFKNNQNHHLIRFCIASTSPEIFRAWQLAHDVAGKVFSRYQTQIESGGLENPKDFFHRIGGSMRAAALHPPSLGFDPVDDPDDLNEPGSNCDGWLAAAKESIKIHAGLDATQMIEKAIEDEKIRKTLEKAIKTNESPRWKFGIK